MRLFYYPPILMYHRMDDDIAAKDVSSVSLASFKSQMSFLKRHNYDVVSSERVPHQRKKTGITFDDGFRDNLEALEILHYYKFPATIFLITGNVGKRGFLGEQDIEMIKQKYEGISFGSHTISHAYLPDISKDHIYEELLKSREDAKQKYGLDFKTLAYPVGGFTHQAMAIAKELGYVAAFTTNRGFEGDLCYNPYAIRRIKMKDRDSGIRIFAKLSGFYDVVRKLKGPY